MNTKNVEKKSGKAKGSRWVRASISFPSDMYETLERLAEQKKVSLAWVVRDAAEKYIGGGTKRKKEGAI